MDGDQICRKLEVRAAAGAGLDELLREAVRLLHEDNPRFHWTGIYELFPDDVLRLGPYIGASTDHVEISTGQGVCGSAVADRCNKNIPDVTQVPNYLACSTSTRSELVVLIRKNGEIFAQVDIDSHDYDAFDEDAVMCVQRVADWLADAYVERGRPRHCSMPQATHRK